MAKISKILVTGFQPFLGETINPSEILLNEIKKDFSVSAGVSILLLPVSFDRAFDLLRRDLEQNEYSAILLLGQAGGREKICLERVALNWVETESPDEDGYTPQQAPIMAEEGSALFTSFPIDDYVKEFKNQSLPVSVSLSAGGYVCNYVYFKTLQLLRSKRKKTQTVFIHFPYLPEQATGKPPGMPFLELEAMKKVLYSIIAKQL